MTDEVEISALDEHTVPLDGDLIAVATDVGGGALVTKKMTRVNFIGLIKTSELADPYDVVYLKVFNGDEALIADTGLMYFTTPDVHNGKTATNVTIALVTTSSSGNVVVRVYNITKTQYLTASGITVTAGNRTGTAVVTNGALSTNDRLRIDVTSEGTGAEGLDVMIKVDKS